MGLIAVNHTHTVTLAVFTQTLLTTAVAARPQWLAGFPCNHNLTMYNNTTRASLQLAVARRATDKDGITGRNQQKQEELVAMAHAQQHYRYT